MKKLLLQVSFVFMVSLAGAQDNGKIEMTEEAIDTVNFNDRLNWYNKVIRADVEELQIFKVDLISPVSYATYLIVLANDSTITSYPFLTLSYEQKINTAFSWVIGGSIRAGVEKFELKGFEVNSGLRYYYNLKRRILKGKSA